MNPTEVGTSYDAIVDQWQNPKKPLTGIEAHRRALRFLKIKRHALNVGCGCDGRFNDLLDEHHFKIDGIDVSARMVELARLRNPTVQFHHADICQWIPQKTYDFITAWDSIWHVPLGSQPSVLTKLCDALAPGGVLIFTMGGTDHPGEVYDEHMGVPMYTATAGIPKTLAVLEGSGCVCRHLEFDQYPQLHVVLIAQKVASE